MPYDNRIQQVCESTIEIIKLVKNHKIMAYFILYQLFFNKVNNNEHSCNRLNKQVTCDVIFFAVNRKPF